MSQKELLYVEDIYNHELLIINMINDVLTQVSDDKYVALLESHLKTHESLNKKLLKLVEGEC